MLESSSEVPKRTLINRWFGAMKPGSYRGSTLTLIASMIGVGFVTLPYIGNKNGLLALIILVILSTTISTYSNYLLGKAFSVSFSRSYPHMVEKLFGMKDSLVVLITLYLDILASQVGLYIFSFGFGYSIFTGLGIGTSYIKSQEDFVDIFMPFFMIVSFLFSIPKKLSALKYISMLAAIMNVAVMLILIVQTPSYRAHSLNYGAIFTMFKFDMNLCRSYCLTLFTVVNQFAVISILAEYKNPTPRRITKLVVRAPIIPLIIYLGVSGAGYLSLGSNTPAVIIDREPLPNSKDVLMNICKAGLLVTLIVANTLRIQLDRTCLLEIYDKFIIMQKGKDPSNKTPSHSVVKKAMSEGQQLTISDIMKEKDRGFFLPVLLNWLHAGIPAILGIMLSNYIIAYIEMAAGLLAPVFLVYYPCKIILKLAKQGKLELGKINYYWIWFYLIFMSVLSYSCLGYTVYDEIR